MKIKNLEKNILYLLRNKQAAWQNQDGLETRKILERYGDIPEKNIHKSLEQLNKNQLIKISSDKRYITITPKGLAKVKELIF